jgi:UDP-glucose 4-epimerase
MKILVTGGMGYIGSHTVVELQNAGYDVVALDNLSNANRSVQERVQRITGKPFTFIEADIRDRAAMEAAFAAHKPDAVIHFAGLKAVGESVAQPLRYYDNNVSGSVVLFETMGKFGCKTLVFSSSATVYGDPASVPIREDFPLSATNPYGRSKLHIEEMLRDLIKAEPDWHIALLRYFNPVGAHESGLIGEEPNGIPNNLVPYIAQVANGQREKLSVFGGDYPTPDGTGNGNSVLEMVHAFEKACGKPIPYQIVDRRPGDIAKCYADPTRARDELGWTAQRDVAQMCADTWRYQITPK